MKNDIAKGLVKELCIDFVDAILVGFEECEEDFPYALATIDYISALYKKGIYLNLNVFNERIRDNIYREFINYLGK